MRYTTLMRGAQPVMAMMFEYDMTSDTLKDGNKTYSLQDIKPGKDNRILIARLPHKSHVLRAHMKIQHEGNSPYVDSAKRTHLLQLQLDNEGVTTFSGDPNSYGPAGLDQYDKWKKNIGWSADTNAEATEVYLTTTEATQRLEHGKLTVVVQYIVRGRATQIN